jgi:hypothetical protein
MGYDPHFFGFDIRFATNILFGNQKHYIMNSEDVIE